MGSKQSLQAPAPFFLPQVMLGSSHLPIFFAPLHLEPVCRLHWYHLYHIAVCLLCLVLVLISLTDACVIFKQISQFASVDADDDLVLTCITKITNVQQHRQYQRFKKMNSFNIIKELGQKGKNSFCTEDYYGNIHNFARKSRKVIKSWTSFCHLPF